MSPISLLLILSLSFLANRRKRDGELHHITICSKVSHLPTYPSRRMLVARFLQDDLQLYTVSQESEGKTKEELHQQLLAQCNRDIVIDQWIDCGLGRANSGGD